MRVPIMPFCFSMPLNDIYCKKHPTSHGGQASIQQVEPKQINGWDEVRCHI